MNKIKYIIFSFIILALFSCNKDCEEIDLTTPVAKKTENVIIVIMDGARYSETWGDSTKQYIPELAGKIKNKATLSTEFYNDGYTLTLPGHTAITTGNQQNIDNTGLDLPDNPSIFQYYLKTTKHDSTDAWIISSKDKLEVLANCKDVEWKNKYMPSTDCGVSGLGSGYRDDSTTFAHAIDILSTYHPHLVLINFKQPDAAGHAGDWNLYLEKIKKTDEYIGKLYDFIDTNLYYQDKTALFIMNDHGRHLDTISNGFVGHGDDCEGCRHIMFFAAGPDFYYDKVISTHHSLIDVPTTVASILDFDFPTGKGKEISGIFK